DNRWLITIVDRKPQGYVPLQFPALYWPFPVSGTQVRYLYDAHDIWRFTLYWTLISIVGVHMVAAAYAMAMQVHQLRRLRMKGRKVTGTWWVIGAIPVVYLIAGGIEALIAGNVVGGLIGGVYTSGYFRMSTWIPFSWGLINAGVLILSSFAIQGGL
ncbi:integral membrane protein, partial [Teratosphaeria destructans]